MTTTSFSTELTQEIAAARAQTTTLTLSRSAATFRDKVALKYLDREYTYRQLDDAVTVAAVRLREMGVTDGTRIACMGKNSDAFVILFYAAARANSIHVPVNFALTGRELAYILSDSESQMLFADPDLVETAQRTLDNTDLDEVLPLYGSEDAFLESVLEVLDDPVKLEATLEKAPDNSRLGDQDIAQLLYTSGTTSNPKGTMLSHQALTSHHQSSAMALDMTGDDQPLIAMPLYHSAAMHVFLGPYFFVGATVRLTTKPDIAEILQLVEEEKIGSLFLAPTVWVPLSQHPDLATRDLSSLTKAQYGASIMPVTVLKRLQEKYPDIGFYNCFGQTEMSPLTCVLRPEEHAERPAAAGRPIYNVQIRVVDPLGEPVDVGTPGEVQYRSPHLFSGYWNKPEATEEAFQDGWFRSGDQVVMDEEGYIQVVDRIKDVINTGGVLVASREVEDAIYEHDAVAEVAVVGRDDERWVERIVAVVTLKPGANLEFDELIEFLRERLAAFKLPKELEIIDELPRNQSGKILKRKLR